MPGSTATSSAAQHGLGPHLDDVAICSGDREPRLYGSQGEQRVAVLALLLAEADAIAERADAPPLLLLDDVLSELDVDRRRGARGAAAGGRADRPHGDERRPLRATPASSSRSRPAREAAADGADRRRGRARAAAPAREGGRRIAGRCGRRRRPGRGAERLAGAARPATARSTSRRRRRRGRSSSPSSRRSCSTPPRERSPRPRRRRSASPSGLFRAARRRRRGAEPRIRPTRRRTMPRRLRSPAGSRDETLRELVAGAAAASLSRARWKASDGR